MTSLSALEAERQAAIDALRLEQRVRLARVDLATWCDIAGQTEIGPWKPYRWQVHAIQELQALSYDLERMEREHAEGAPSEQVRLTLETLTQVGKTELSARFLAWHLARTGQGIAVASYSDDFARDISGRARTILRSGMARRVFPHLGRAVDPNEVELDEFGQAIKDTETEWTVPHPVQGRRNVRFVARGLTGSINGRVVWLVWCDDLLKSISDYDSPATRAQIDSFVRSQAVPRVQQRGGCIAIVGSRYGNRDPHAAMKESCKASGTRLVELRYPLRAPSDSPDGRAPGEYITPSWSEVGEAALREELGRRMSRAILDCDPEQDGGGVWSRADFSRRYLGRPEDIARTCSRTWLAVDGAETAGSGDWSVVVWWGERSGRFLKLGQWRQQVEYPELRALVADRIGALRPSATYIEKKSSGKAVYQELSRTLPVIGVDVTRSKRDRYNAALPTMQHLCDYPEAQHAPWVGDYVDRMVALSGDGDEVDDEADADTLGLLAVLHGAAPVPTARDALSALAALTGRR